MPRLRCLSTVPIGAARDQHVAASRKQHLGAAEDVGEVPFGRVRCAVQTFGRVPDVVDEIAGRLAVGLGAVGHHPAVAQQNHVDRDDRPGRHPGPHAPYVLLHVRVGCVNARASKTKCQSNNDCDRLEQAQMEGIAHEQPCRNTTDHFDLVRIGRTFTRKHRNSTLPVALPMLP